MMKWIDKNKMVLFIAALLLSFVWAGKKMKQGREEQQKTLAAQVQVQSESSQSVPEVAIRPGSNLHPQGLHILSETYDKDGKKVVLLSDKSKEQLAKEQRIFEIAKMQVKRDEKTFGKAAADKVEVLARTRFKVDDFQRKISQVAERKNISDNERSNDYIRLKNQVMMSATGSAEKEKILSQIDAKIDALSPAPFKGYVTSLQKDGSVMLTPK